MINARLIDHETGKTAHTGGGLTLFVTLIFGESWRLLYIFSPSFFFFSFSAILGGWKGKGGGEGGGGY